MKAALYGYVSYLNGEHFLKNHIDKCREFCKNHHYDVVKEYHDLASREAFSEMMSDAKKGQFEIVIIYDLRIFGRDKEKFKNIATELKKANTSIGVVNEFPQLMYLLDPESPLCMLMENLPKLPPEEDYYDEDSWENE